MREAVRKAAEADEEEEEEEEEESRRAACWGRLRRSDARTVFNILVLFEERRGKPNDEKGEEEDEMKV